MNNVHRMEGKEEAGGRSGGGRRGNIAYSYSQLLPGQSRREYVY